jgi:hypothetical protein
VKLDLKAVLGAGPPVDAPAKPVPPATTQRLQAPSAAGSTKRTEPGQPTDRPKPDRLPTAKPTARERVAVNVPGELVDFARLQAAHGGDYLTDVVLEALAQYGPGVVQRAQDRIAARGRPPRRSARQRGVKYPTLLVLYLSGAERRELDEAATSATMTRSAFVAELLTLAGADKAAED